MANKRFIDFPIATTVGDNDIILIWQSGANKQTTKATILSGVPDSLNDLTDVTISGLTNGQILRYDSVSGQWENTDQGNLDLNDLNDVTIVSPTNGQVLVYNSSTSKWENSSGGYVPYVGAVTTVNLGAQTIQAGSFVKQGGTAGQFLKANGSVDSTAYGTGSVTSVALTMPTAFSVAGSPITTAGTLAVTGAGTVAQYIRGDGSLADFPETSGGGASVSYYLNGSVAQGTIGGVAYKEMNKVPIFGAGTDFTINANGYIASFITDAGDPNLIEIPGGNWNFETYFSASSGGGSPTFYVELYKVNSGGTATLIASNSANPEFIAFGTNITAYFTTLAVPTTTLALTDRLAVRYYVTHSGRTITLHTEGPHLCQIITTFTTGLTALNGLTAQVQNFAVGTTGTDFNIASAVATHTFNLPTASATNRGALSSADWALFTQAYNDKINSAAVTGTTTKTLTLTQQDGGTITASWSDLNTDAVLSVFGRTGAVIAVSGDYTTAQVTESGNLYYTEARVNANANVAANTAARHNAVTIGTANGLSLSTQQLSLGLASAGVTGALSGSDWSTFNSKVSSQWITSGSNIYYSAGSVGIGTNNPVLHSLSTGLVVRGSSRGIIELWDATAGKAVFQQVGGDTYIGSLDKGTGSGDLYLLVNGSGNSADNSAIFKANGNVGIGILNPTTYSLSGKHFELFGGDSYAFIHNNTTSVKSFLASNEINGTSALFTFSNHALLLGTNNIEAIRIFTSRNVHIGPTPTSDNGARLQVSGEGRFKVSTDRNLAIKYDTNITISGQADSGGPESLRIYADTFRIYTSTTAAGLTERFTISNTGAATFSGTLRTFGDIYAANGTSTAASIRFWDANSGLYHPGSDALGFITNGTQKMVILSNGNVGIGTPSPNANSRLHVYRAGGSYDTIIADGDAGTNTGFAIYEGGSARYALYSNGAGGNDSFNIYNFGAATNSLTIFTNGNVGISSASDNGQAIVQIGGSNNTKLSLKDGSSQNGMRWESVAGANAFYLFNGNFGTTGWGLYNITTTATPLWITNGGNIGIGTNNPSPHNGSNALIIQGGSGGRSIMELHESSGGGGKAVFQQVGGDTYLGSLAKGSGSGDLYLLVTTTTPNISMLLKGNGNVLIGTQSDNGSKLRVNGSLALPHVTKSANYTLDATDYTVGFDCASNRTANLPDATTCAGRIYVIYQYNTNFANRSVTLDGNGSQTIDGVTTYNLIGADDFSSVMIQSNGSNWIVIADKLYYTS